jgi:hypothetical protein
MRALTRLAVCALLVWIAWADAPALRGATPSGSVAQSVDAVGMTVSNMDRSIAFFTDVLTFQKTSDIEVAGDDYERLQAVFGVRMRIVRMRLGTEQIVLTEYLTRWGRPIPDDSR